MARSISTAQLGITRLIIDAVCFTTLIACTCIVCMYMYITEIVQYTYVYVAYCAHISDHSVHD